MTFARILNSPPFAAFVAVTWLTACTQTDTPGPRTDSTTHLWLAACDSDAECGTEYACVCGLCTWPCGPAAPCPQGLCQSEASVLDATVCMNTGIPVEGGVCLAACTDDDCSVATGLVCQDGLCTELDSAPAVCTIDVTGTVGEFSEQYDAQPSCDCTPDTPSCHTLYRWSLAGSQGTSVTLSFQKAANSGNPTPSAPVQWWLVALQESDCAVLEDALVIQSGTWSEGTTVSTTLQAATLADLIGDTGGTVSLGFITGGGDLPTEKIFFTRDLIPVTLTCGQGG
jgi:hypothetical protein